jgi:S1-C subfamily serine protease
VLKLGRLIFFVFLSFYVVSCAHTGTNFQQKILPIKSFVKVEKSLTVSACQESTGCVSQDLRSVASGVVVHGTLRGAYVLTAAHVCDDSDIKAEYKSLPDVKFISKFHVRTLEGDTRTVEILDQNKDHDICMLWVRNLFMQAVTLSPSAPKPGDRVFNIAAPLGIFSKNMVPVFEGFYNGTDEEGNALYSIPAIGGSSGSPIVNKKGELVGMIHSVIRYFNQVSISPNYKAMRKFIYETIDEHSSRNYFHSVLRTFIK